jgi:anaerobic magnesium-protoporphyrin IX monomethyl ester cyclase
MRESNLFLSDRRPKENVRTVDTILIGYNDVDFDKVVEEVRSMGEDNVAYKDLGLNYIELEGKPYRAQDVLTRFYRGPEDTTRPFKNYDLLWPAILPIGTFLHKQHLTFGIINDFQREKDILKEKLLSAAYASVTITTTIYISDLPILDLIAFIRRYNQDIKIIVGGPYMSKQTEEKDPETLQAFLKYIGADFYVFSKEGEYALSRILWALKEGKPFSDIHNIAFLQEGTYRVTDASPEDNPLGDNPIDYSLFPPELIGEYLNIKTSKSCPFECAFCAFPLRAERYVYTDEDWIKQQLDGIRRIGTVKLLFFSDDTFNIPLSRFKAIMRMMIREQYGFQWHCFYRCVNSDEEAIALMKEAGCLGVFLGIESGNDMVLTAMNKKARRIDYSTAIPLFRKYGILTFASIFFGFPGETYETAEDTMMLIAETQPDFCRPLVWYCDTTTPIWKARDKYGIKGTSFNWKHNSMDSRMAYDLMEDAFFRLTKPTVYVPDPGFNFISIYYLISRGFTVEQIKGFLSAFHVVIKQKILGHGSGRAALDNLVASCDLMRTQPVHQDPIHSGENYGKAVQYYTDMFRDFDSRSAFLKTKRSGSNAMKIMGMDISLHPAKEVLSAYLILIHLLENKNKIALVALLKNGYSVPVCIDFTELETFQEVKQEVEKVLEGSRDISYYAWHLLSNPYRLRQYQCEGPQFHYCFKEGDRNHPLTSSHIKLSLHMPQGQHEGYLEFDPEAVEPIQMQYVKKYLGYILSEGQDIPLSSIKLNPSSPQAHHSGKGHFKFN